jgi:hypothetical protein
MKTFKERFLAVLQTLKLVDKAKAKELTQEDWDAISQNYKETHNSDFYVDQDLAQKNKEKAASHDKALEILDEVTDVEETEETTEENNETAPPPPANEELTNKVNKLVVENRELKATVEKFANRIDNKPPEEVETEITIVGAGHTATHLFGQKGDFFARSHRWNELMANPSHALVNPIDEEATYSALRKATTSYGRSLIQRMSELHGANQLNPEILSTAFTTDYSGFSGSGIPDQFLVRRMDALIARILKIKRITDFFPVRYGVQDREVIFNVLFSAVSQAWQKGKIFKGSAKIQPEVGHVDDVSIKLEFEPMVEIERMYIGYLNTEGSEDIKWTMIEWLILNIFEKAVSEMNERNVMGCYMKPETGKAGHELNAATGVVYTIIRYLHEHKLQELSDDAYNSYDNASTNFIDAVFAFLEDVEANLADGEKLENFTLLLNAKHKSWWLQNVRAKFGKDTDFAGPRSNEVPDYEIPIYWMPSLGHNTFIILSKPGNGQILANKPGEMFNIKMNEDFEDILVRSRFKEGAVFSFVGEKFNTRSLLEGNDFENQQIFINKPAIVAADDATTVDGKNHIWHITQANTTSGKKISDISNAKKGRVYIIECGSTTNKQVIDKADKFSEISSNWVPTATHDYIMVALNDAGDKFLELERCVGGTRTINGTLQPNVPGVR